MKEKTICRGDLFYYDFGDNSGSVQSGERPVLVVQADDYNQNAPTIIVAAVTSVIKKRYLPSHHVEANYLTIIEFQFRPPSTKRRCLLSINHQYVSLHNACIIY